MCTYPELDCDDSRSYVNPGILEEPVDSPVCSDGLDNDCDGLVDFPDEIPCHYPWTCSEPADCDDGNPCTEEYCLLFPGWCVFSFLDADGDGHGSEACGGDDCDEDNPYVYSGAPELCDLVDNQCPGDVGYGDVDEGGCDQRLFSVSGTFGYGRISGNLGPPWEIEGTYTGVMIIDAEPYVYERNEYDEGRIRFRITYSEYDITYSDLSTNTEIYQYMDQPGWFGSGYADGGGSFKLCGQDFEYWEDPLWYLGKWDITTLDHCCPKYSEIGLFGGLTRRF